MMQPLVTHEQVSYARSWSGYTAWRGKHAEEPDPLQQYQQDLLKAYQVDDASHTIEVQYMMRMFLCRTHDSLPEGG